MNTCTVACTIPVHVARTLIRVCTMVDHCASFIITLSFMTLYNSLS